MVSLLSAALALALPAPAAAASGAVSVDLLQEAIAAPGAGGLSVFTPPLHPGAQAEGLLRYVDTPAFAFGQTARLGGWAHAGVAGFAFLSTTVRAELRVRSVALALDLFELGGGLAFLDGHRYTVSEDGLGVAPDPGQPRLLLAGGGGLVWRLPGPPLSLRLLYRAGVEARPPPVFNLPFLPHSTISVGMSYEFGGGG